MAARIQIAGLETSWLRVQLAAQPPWVVLCAATAPAEHVPASLDLVRRKPRRVESSSGDMPTCMVAFWLDSSVRRSAFWSAAETEPSPSQVDRVWLE